jgi:hypothetical protein
MDHKGRCSNDSRIRDDSILERDVYILKSNVPSVQETTQPPLILKRHDEEW